MGCDVFRHRMLYYLTAIGLVAHTCFWGLGLALISLPRFWRRWAWLFAPGFGFALQSAVVWAGVHTSVAGTEVYARWTELIPLTLLAVGIVQNKGPLMWRFGGLSIIAVFTGWFFLAPMTKSGSGLTTSSLGNCDQADYAAGARVFQEFSRDDRTGFLGLPEVTKVRSADYFFDFWVRLNHFTPSALIAHNAAVFGVPSYRLVSVSAVVVLLLNLPLVFFLGRIAVGLKGMWLLFFLAVYALSPLNAYAVYHGQLGQLYAAHGIGLLTCAIFGASRIVLRGPTVWSFMPMVGVAFWLLAGSYNFIIPVCLAPGGAWLLTQWRIPRQRRSIGLVLAMTSLALISCAAIFWGRFDGLVERFSLFHEYNFGWAMPLFSPEGLLGLLRDSSLNAWPWAIRIILSVATISLWLAGLWTLFLRQKPAAWASLALVVPVMVGWTMLARESRVRANASYDAYKLVAVFLPCLLAGLLAWLPTLRWKTFAVRAAAAFLMTVVLVFNLSRDEHFRRQMAVPPLRVTRNISELELLEKDDRFSSFNMLVDDYWSRLWANAFLLKRPQYFLTHSYEGRHDTPLRGEWNLSDSLLHSVPVRPEDFVQFNSRFFLARVAAPGLMQLDYGDGWYAEERSGPRRWRWCDGNGRIVATNPTEKPVRVRLRLLLQAFLSRDLTLKLNEQSLSNRSVDKSSVQVVEFESFYLPPGQSTLTLAGDYGVPGGGDDRKLAFALYGFEMRALGDN